MKISVAMRTYNGASFLREQLDSIFAQTRLPDELIVCDDQSNDETVSILDDYAARSPFPMKVVVNAQRLGSTENLERVIGLCSGDLIAPCDQDDVWRPHKLAIIERRFVEHPAVGLVFTNADLIDERGAPFSGDAFTRFKFNERRREQLRGARRYNLLLSRSFIVGATVVFQSKFKSLCLPIQEAPNFQHDRWIIVLIAAVSSIDFIEDRLMAYRLHPDQQAGAGKLTLRRYVTPDRGAGDGTALTAIRDRLTTNPSWLPDPAFLHALEVRQRHVAALATCPRNPFGRLKVLTSECRSGRYQLYPKGILGVLKDLIIGTR